MQSRLQTTSVIFKNSVLTRQFSIKVYKLVLKF
ncbi:hypothetical protein LINPERHAP1_LOCUS12785 [Linum perenne]